MVFLVFWVRLRLGIQFASMFIGKKYYDFDFIVLNGQQETLVSIRCDGGNHHVEGFLVLVPVLNPMSLITNI